MFNIVTSSLGFIVATTTLLVGLVILYSNVAVGSSLSIQSTTAVTFPLIPLESIYSKSKLPFSSNV